MTAPLFRLNNGIELPALGLGVFQTPPDETTAAATEALRVGHRHIDTAATRTHDKSPAQVMLRWGIQEGRSVIPKSTRPERITENFGGFDFELSAAEISAIDALDTGVRGGPDPASIPLETFGRTILEA